MYLPEKLKQKFYDRFLDLLDIFFLIIFQKGLEG